MATQIKSGAMVSGRGQREASGGKRDGKRQRRGVALIAALVLALLASVAASQALPARPAGSGAPGQHRVIQQDPDADADAMVQAARPADTFDWEQWDRWEQWEDRAPLASPQPRDTFDWEQADRTQASPGWLDARDYAPAAASPATDHGQQAGLYAIEVRDTGHGTPGGDGGPCHTPGRSCNR